VASRGEKAWRNNQYLAKWAKTQNARRKRSNQHGGSAEERYLARLAGGCLRRLRPLISAAQYLLGPLAIIGMAINYNENRKRQKANQQRQNQQRKSAAPDDNRVADVGRGR